MYCHRKSTLLCLPTSHLLPVVVRQASSSTAKHPFPFPSHSHPTPHQIFHLPYGATQRDIKARYFDLVKIYHPDSVYGRNIPDKARHSQFQSITQAYDVLRGKAPLNSFNDPVRAELERRRRHSPPGHSHPRPQTTNSTAGGRGWGARNYAHDFPWSSDAEWGARTRKVEGWNDQWKDKVIICAAVLAVGAAVFPSLMYAGPAQIEQRHRSAAANLAQARAEAREFGHERRAEIRRRVQETQESERKQEDQRVTSE